VRRRLSENDLECRAHIKSLDMAANRSAALEPEETVQVKRRFAILILGHVAEHRDHLALLVQPDWLIGLRLPVQPRDDADLSAPIALT
jgi:hypothetical protein